MRKIFGVAAIFVIFLISSAEAKVYVAEPLLVPQPTYAGMTFYVYKPYNMPKDWYATFDGYPVKKNSDGVWVYGTYSGPNLVPTNYIVGSVVPSMAGLSPYIGQVQISSVTSVPDRSRQAITAKQPGTARVPAGNAESTYMPDWLFVGRFVALGKWKGTVDRIGVLHNPPVPVAWKGSSPKVIYVWTGQTWYQINANGDERPSDILRNHQYELSRMVKRNEYVWYEADTPVFAQQATAWGYYWMGEVMAR
ncbi:hypothetical protein FACS1894187_15630 [Synergistales bacterium]|nr:hypothetical protein FACS1894187_15630 [Synergistales bacterium]